MVTYLVADGQLDVTIANAKFEAQLLAEHTPFAATARGHSGSSFAESLMMREGENPGYQINGMPSSIVRPDITRTKDGFEINYPQGGQFNVCQEALHLVCRRVLAQNSGFFVHSAGLVLDDEGWLFPGPSGHGKSTIGRYGGFDETLCDEWCIVRLVNGQPWIWGTSRWSEGRTQPKTTRGVPLRYICSLTRSTETSIRPINKASVFELLVSQILFNGENPSMATRYFELSTQVLDRVQTVEIGWHKDRPCAETARWYAHGEASA